MMKKTEIPGIYRTEIGFQVRVSKRDPISGRQIEKTKSLNNTFDIQDAISVKEELVVSLREELSEGKDSFRDISKSSYEAYSKFYQKYRLDNGIAKKNVVSSDEYVFNKFIIPHIGRIKLASVNKRVVYYFLECLRGQMNSNGVPFSKKTYGNAYSLLKASLRMAYRLGFLQEDPTALVCPKFPLAKAPKQKRSLSKEDAAKLLSVAADENEKIYFMFSCLLILGLRTAEVKALTWGDINWKNNFIRINKSHHKGVTSGTTKNGTVFNAPMIGLVRDAAEKYFQKIGSKCKEGQLIFPSERSKSYMDNSYIRKVLHRLCDAANVERISPHDCRRSANTILLLSSVSPEICRRVLNHQSQEMTAHYAQISTEQAGEVLEAVWSEIKG